MIDHVRNRGLILLGKPMTIKAAWQQFAHPTVSFACMRRRLYRNGWPIEKALTVPQQPPGAPRKGGYVYQSTNKSES